MLKLCYGVLTVATIAAAIGPASAQQPTTPPAAAAQSDSGQSAAPAGAFSYFVNLKNGDTVTSPFKVVFGLSPNNFAFALLTLAVWPLLGAIVTLFLRVPSLKPMKKDV